MIYIKQGDYVIRSQSGTVSVKKEMDKIKEVYITIETNFDVEELMKEPVIECIKKEMKRRGVVVRSVSIKRKAENLLPNIPSKTKVVPRRRKS